MFKQLQRKWQLNNHDFFRVFICFAVTGTVTAWLSRSISSWLEAEEFSWEWWLLKISVLVIGYPVLLLLFGFLFGQFSFFRRFEKKLFTRMGFLKQGNITTNIAIFASGAGSNADVIAGHFEKHSHIYIKLIVTNRINAGVNDVAARHGIPVKYVKGEELSSKAFLDFLTKVEISWIVLAGFLLKIPAELIAAYPRHIINLHPALLPAYGGKGMYGSHVHAAVINNKEKSSGITFHFVDEIYDHGEIIGQYSCPVHEDDTIESLARRIHSLEHKHFATEIESVLLKAK